ncbi:hypothetical protein LLG95_14515 [bacterium]|nr:hypothetical protein [bacterium]
MIARSSSLWMVMLLAMCALGCSRAARTQAGHEEGPAARAPEKTEARSQPKPAHVTKKSLEPRKQYLFEIELLAMPTKAYGKVDEGLRAQVDSGRIDTHAVHQFLSNSQTRILLRPRLLVCDGDDGNVRIGESNDARPKEDLEITVTPVSQPDGTVRVTEVLAIPMLNNKGKAAPATPDRTIYFKTERKMIPSPDLSYVERFINREGFDYLVFLKVSQE